MTVEKSGACVGVQEVVGVHQISVTAASCDGVAQRSLDASGAIADAVSDLLDSAGWRRTR